MWGSNLPQIRQRQNRYLIIPLLFIVSFLFSSCDLGKNDRLGIEKGKLAGVKTWAYQIQDQNAGSNIDKLIDSHYDLLVIDQTRSLLGDEGYDSKDEVSLLKKSDNSTDGQKIVICYLDVGEAEGYRWYWQDNWEVGSPEWIVAEDPDGWDENYPVKFWRQQWKKIMKQAIDKIIDDGYDGIYMDWLEVYSFEPVAKAAKNEGLDSVEEMIEFVNELADYARLKKKDFIIIAQNAAELGEKKRYIDVFDAIAQEAIWFDGGDSDKEEKVGDVRNVKQLTGEYIKYLNIWQKANKPILDVEYATTPKNAVEAYELGNKNGFLTYVTTRPLDSLTKTKPLNY